MRGAIAATMVKSGLAASVVLSLVVIFALWLAGNAFGFHVSLFGSLALSLGLTLILNLVLGLGRRRRGW